MKNLFKHEKVAILLILISIILLFVSCCPGGIEEATGILQGIATGIMSGTILAMITGIKSRESADIEEKYDTLHKFNGCLLDMMQLHSTLYHNTYHGKINGNDYETYLKYIEDTWNGYYDVYAKIGETKSDVQSVLDSETFSEVKELKDIIDSDVREIPQGINVCKMNGNKNIKDLDRLKDKLYSSQSKAYEIFFKSNMLEKELGEKMKRIKSSLI